MPRTLAYRPHPFQCQPVTTDSHLIPLLQPITGLAAPKPPALKAIVRLVGGERLLDLLFHLPETHVDRRTRSTVAEAEPGRIATIALEIRRVGAPARRGPWRAVGQDETGPLEIVLFNALPWQVAPYAEGRRVTVSGRVSVHGGIKQIVAPDWVEPPERIPAVEPVWPLTAGVIGKQLARAMSAALAALPEDLPEWHDAALLKREHWPGFAAALRMLHAPQEMPGPLPRRRLAYDELLAGQIALCLVRRRVRTRRGRALLGDGRYRAEALRRFGHDLTPGQRQALADIDDDLGAPTRMLRLLQGDVGSGKTLIALLAMLRATEAGAQAALMAPTEVLAKQHHRTLSRLSPVPVGLLTGSVKGKQRERVLRSLADGTLPLVVGTHALFQEAVTYRDLALAVIDEQHRFGVHQRLLMGGKGALTDVLVMTATPIPRTLLLTQWGEMEVSRLRGRPAGRQPIRTTLHSLSAVEDVVAACGRAMEAGARIYWVCPMVAESEAVDLAAAEARAAALRERFGEAVGLAHGKQEAAVRDAALADFAAGRSRLLVATTVVEVGVDVPEATVIVIEHAERFGLAQLHQLRGRVGRGTARSYCMLLYADGLNEIARRRLLTLRDTEDGFVIADEDFRLRGAGDALGTRQSGLPGFRLADPHAHEDLIRMAARDAALLLDRDPRLETPRGRAARALLELFDRASAMNTILSG